MGPCREKKKTEEKIQMGARRCCSPHLSAASSHLASLEAWLTHWAPLSLVTLKWK